MLFLPLRVGPLVPPTGIKPTDPCDPYTLLQQLTGPLLNMRTLTKEGFRLAGARHCLLYCYSLFHFIPFELILNL